MSIENIRPSTSTAAPLTNSVVSSRRFFLGGREFLLEGQRAATENAFLVSLFDGGRLRWSDTIPSIVAGAGVFPAGEIEKILETAQNDIAETFVLREKTLAKADITAHIMSARLFESWGILEEALVVYRLAEKLTDSEDTVLNAHGQCLMAHGDFEAAAEKLRRAIELKPLYADYRAHYACALLWDGRITPALAQLNQALELNIYFADAYYLFGLAYLYNAIRRVDHELMRDFKSRAVAALEKAVVIDPAYKTAEFSRGMEILRGSDVPSAFASLRRSREETLRRHGLSFSVQKTDLLARLQSFDFDALGKRIAALEAEIEKHPEFVDVAYQLAVAQFSLASAQWRKGIDTLGGILAQKPRMKSAVEALEVARLTLTDMEGRIDTMRGPR